MSIRYSTQQRDWREGSATEYFTVPVKGISALLSAVLSVIALPVVASIAASSSVLALLPLRG